MHKQRVEAFSDGVIAILITIMVFDIKPPSSSDFPALQALGNGIMTYVLSFVYLGIYWNNHHHMFQATRRVNGAVLWATCTCSFGCHCCQSPRTGFERVISAPFQWRHTESFSWSLRFPISYFNRQSSSPTGQVRRYETPSVPI